MGLEPSTLGSAGADGSDGPGPAKYCSALVPGPAVDSLGSTGAVVAGSGCGSDDGTVLLLPPPSPPLPLLPPMAGDVDALTGCWPGGEVVGSLGVKGL